MCALLGIEAPKDLDYAALSGRIWANGFMINDFRRRPGRNGWAHQTMLINENRLTPIEPAASEVYRTRRWRNSFSVKVPLPPDPISYPKNKPVGIQAGVRY